MPIRGHLSNIVATARQGNTQGVQAQVRSQIESFLEPVFTSQVL